MKINVFAILFVLTSMTSQAQVLKESNIKCFTDRFDAKISIDLNQVELDGETKTGRIESYHLGHVVEESIAELSPFQNVSVMSGSDISNVDYNGRKYKNYLKFYLVNSKTTGDFSPDYVDLIIEPRYEVIKTIQHANHWDSTRSWTEEFRKYSAVLSFSYSDHHGDYASLTCISRSWIKN